MWHTSRTVVQDIHEKLVMARDRLPEPDPFLAELERLCLGFLRAQ